jgi:hypothetical protein
VFRWFSSAYGDVFLTGVTMNQQPAYSTEKNNCDGLTRIRFCAPVRQCAFRWVLVDAGSRFRAQPLMR